MSGDTAQRWVCIQTSVRRSDRRKTHDGAIRTVCAAQAEGAATAEAQLEVGDS